MGVALVVGARLLSRYRPRATMLTGLGLLGVGTWPLTTLSATTSFDLLAGALALRGIGTGLLITALMTTLYAGVRKDEVAPATTASRTLQQLAGSFGVAILAVALQGNLTGLAAGEGAGGGPRPGALAGAYGGAFWIVLVAGVVALVPVLFVPNRQPEQPVAARP